MIYTHQHLAGMSKRLSADVVVIGSGAGGAPAAFELAQRGLRVIVLEAGSYWRPQDFTQVEYDMFQRLYADKAGRTTRDRAIHVHQGEGVGGSTLHNLNLCARVPPAVLDQWRATYGWKHLPAAALDSIYDAVEQHLSVSRLGSENLNGNNAAFKRGCEALGYRGGFLSHNRVGCAASGFCELGCPFDAKQNALKIYLADAVTRGADILANTRATLLDLQGRKATSVRAVVRDPLSGVASAELVIDCRALCVSASATGTPALLLHSRVPDPQHLVGSRLFLHPGAAVAARFEQPLESWRGVPQSYECTEFLDFSPDSERRVWLVPTFAHPAGVSATLSSFGRAHAEQLRGYPHLAAVSAMVHDAGTGRVTVTRGGGMELDYELHEGDAEQLRRGLREAARILLAAGAQKVFVPLARTVEISSLADVDSAFENIAIRKHDTDLTSVHPMGSAWMGDDPARACVESTGRYHHLDNVFVADTSLYPSSIGVPPQLTAYALGTHVGRQIAAYLA